MTKDKNYSESISNSVFPILMPNTHSPPILKFVELLMLFKVRVWDGIVHLKVIYWYVTCVKYYCGHAEVSKQYLHVTGEWR